MSDSTQQYILKQPIDKDLLTLLLEQHWVSGFKEAQKKTADIYTTKKHSASFMEKLFVPLDIPVIEKQLDEIASKTSVRIAHDLQYEERTWDEDRAIVEGHVSNLISELKALFGLENKERQSFESEEVASKIIDEQIEDEEERYRWGDDT